MIKNVKIALCYFKGDTSVDLSVKSEENVEYMVEAIKKNYVWLMLER